MGTAGSEYAFYIADGQNGIRAVDVTDPQNPLEKACARRYGPHSVSEDGEYIYVADVRKGFVILKYLGANANE